MISTLIRWDYTVALPSGSLTIEHVTVYLRFFHFDLI